MVRCSIVFVPVASGAAVIGAKSTAQRMQLRGLAKMPSFRFDKQARKGPLLKNVLSTIHTASLKVKYRKV